MDGTVIGTPRAMAPEQLSGGPITPRTDLYGLGVVLLEALTGRPPYAATTPVALAEAQRAGPPAVDGVDPALAALLLASLAHDPADRPLHAGALASALRSWLAGDPSPAAAMAPAGVASAAARHVSGDAGRSDAGDRIGAAARDRSRRSRRTAANARAGGDTRGCSPRWPRSPPWRWPRSSSSSTRAPTGRRMSHRAHRRLRRESDKPERAHRRAGVAGRRGGAACRGLRRRGGAGRGGQPGGDAQEGRARSGEGAGRSLRGRRGLSRRRPSRAGGRARRSARSPRGSWPRPASAARPAGSRSRRRCSWRPCCGCRS